MSTDKKPNTEYDDPMDQPSTQDLASGPAERAVLGKQGMGGFTGVVIAVLLFIVIFGTMFYFLNS